MLHFFGRGSAFSDTHNSAYFLYEHSLILMDCPMMAFQKLKHLPLLSEITDISVLVTHTHCDHIAGLPLLVHFAFYVLKLPVTVIAPSQEVAGDIGILLDRIEGCDPAGYTLKTAETSGLPFTVRSIPVPHVPSLAGRCFGWYLEIKGQEILYTGDTSSLEPFKPYLHRGVTLYTEASHRPSGVHLLLAEHILSLQKLVQKGVTVYLMHIDNEEKIKAMIQETGIRLAPVDQTGGSTMTEFHAQDTLSGIFAITERLYRGMCSYQGDGHATIFTELTDLGRLLTGADRASFWKWDKRRHELWTLSATGTERIAIPETTGLVGKALREQSIVVTNDPYNDPDFNQAVDKRTGYVTRSILVMPVADINGEFIGAYQMINKPGGFDADEDSKRLSLAALICGIALESDVFQEEAQHDRLTQLKNRMGFYADYLRNYGKLLAVGKQVSMFLCDIDHFKRVNDTYGHNAGDDALSFIAGILRESCREGDCAYRWGGEEFIMLMPNTTVEEAAQIAETIRAHIEQSVCNADGNEIRLTLSFGCASMDGSIPVENNVSIADQRLYTAKETGRNQVIWK